MSLAWAFVVFTLASGAAAHIFAAGRSPDRDCGSFWAEVMNAACCWLGIPMLLVASARNLAVVKPYLPATPRYWLACVALGWLAILAINALRAPKPDEGRWIAGTLQFSPRRFWVLGFFVPFIPSLLFDWSPWPEEIFAAHWAILILFLTALVGIALSAKPGYVPAGLEAKAQDESIALSPWPDEIRSRGVPLEDLAAWEASVPPASVTGAAADWQQRLADAGSPHVSPVLCEAVSRLLWSPQTRDRLAVMLGPDWCGQEELVALVATELSRRHGETTLLIASAPDAALARRLAGWVEKLGAENPIQVADLSADPSLSQAADLFLTDAENLSEFVLDQLRSLAQRDSASDSGQGLGRIGLVIWWNAHEFSGVLAAHVWAVSRRLERLLKARRQPAPRAIVYARPPADREGLFVGFLEHLLPYPLKKDHIFQIPLDFARKTYIYRLGNALPAAAEDAARASLLTDWPTLPHCDLDLDAEMAHRPVDAAPTAGARIVHLQPSEVLAIRQMVCRGGRATSPNLVHHVAIARGHNPYVDFLVARHGDQSARGVSVNLISAEGHPELVRRHLLVGLREVPDTLSGLRGTFHWEEPLLKGILRQLSQENRLSRRAVRFLDPDGRLQRDALYTNQNPGVDGVRSFRTIGKQRAVELRDPKVPDRVLLRVDPERLPIEAYPHRVIESMGRRYRVQTWKTPPARIECIPEPAQVRTWRFFTPRISSIQPFCDRLIFRGVARYTARLDYHEDVNAVWERHPDGTFHLLSFPRVSTSFETQAVILEFERTFPPDQLIGAAAALRHVLPVHIAVEENALQVVPMSDGRGLALVDLYPGGIGLANAIHKVEWLLPMLFDQAAWWLSEGAAGKDASSAFSGPLFRTMGVDRFNPTGALKIFQSAGW